MCIRVFVAKLFYDCNINLLPTWLLYVSNRIAENWLLTPLIFEQFQYSELWDKVIPKTSLAKLNIFA